jgi:hypothetical protein
MPGSGSAAPIGYGGYDFKWSHSEKTLARHAFDEALKRELDELIAETKRRANQIEQADDVWSLVEHLIERRKQINARYDYRYSVLPSVFAALIKAGRLSVTDLEGLDRDKLAEIRRLSKLRY